MSTSNQTAMVYSMRLILCVVFGLGSLLLVGSSAQAQSDTAFQAQQFRPWGDPDGMFQTQSAKTLKQWKYKPATLNGKPVAVYFNLTVNFQLQ